MQYKIEYTTKAKEDISSIHRYISVTLQNPVSANKIAKDILEKCKSLIILPKASRVRFHIHNFEIRFTKSHNYIIAYSIEKPSVL
ncbi:type II toxin-antitoxin system RelE/ParE family toxin [Candidatus Saccharibacteria bacterium]|nr:type II toxin-antitoxin system RelE/ParE family toxin [Candidatus Saccharibacteria bacterium]